eukprot:3857938-Amphidinium_carterae.1
METVAIVVSGFVHGVVPGGVELLCARRCVTIWTTDMLLLRRYMQMLRATVPFEPRSENAREGSCVGVHLNFLEH